MRRRRSRLATCSAVAAAVLGAVLAAPAAWAQTTSTTTTPPATTPAAGGGTPIVVHFVNLDATSSTAPARQGVTAAVKQINRAGGIGGRPIQITECLTDQTPEKGKACIDAAIAAKPTAVFSVQPGTASDSVPALTTAAIPYVAQTCNTSTTLGGQYTTFCFGSDFVGLYASSANYLKTLGTVKKALLTFVDVPAATTGMKAYADPTLQRAGITPVELPISEGTDDVAPTLVPALSGNNPDTVISLLTGPGCVSTMKVKTEQKSTKPFVFPAMCTDPDVVNDGGPGAKGSLFVRQTIALDAKNADVKTYRKAMAKFAPKAEPDDVYAQAGFAGIMNLAAALKQVPAGTTVDATSATAALRAARQVPMFLSPGATFSCDGTAYPGLRALCSVQSHVIEYAGDDKWTDKGVF